MNRSLPVALSFLAVVAAGCAAGPEKSPSPGVLRHVVLFKFKDDAPPEQIRRVESEFRALKGRIPGVQALEWGTNVSTEELAQGFTHCFFVTFAQVSARDAYLPHPAHQDFVKILKPVLDKVLVIDYVAKD